LEKMFFFKCIAVKLEFIQVISKKIIKTLFHCAKSSDIAYLYKNQAPENKK